MDVYSASTNTEDMQFLLYRFDRNKDGKISFQEFEHELRPKSPLNY